MLPRYHQDQQGRQDATHCVPMDALISLEGSILEGQTLNKQGHEVRVTVIQGGQSRNGFVYDEPTLQQLASLLEGAQAYADHDTSASVRSVRDMVGFYTNVSYVPPSPDTTHAHGRVDATLHILEAAAWLCSIIYEAVAIGKPDLPYVPFSDEDTEKGLLAAGLSAEVAKNYTEMGVAIRTGAMFEDYLQHRPALSPTKLEDFAKEFAGAYNA